MKKDTKTKFSIWMAFFIVSLSAGLIVIMEIEKGISENALLVKSAAQQELDIQAYDQKLIAIANIPTTTAQALWPVKTPYPKAGAILPFKRIVAYYGNLYSKNMGALGEYPEDEMLSRLDAEVKKWQAADPDTQVLPALHYIAVVARANPTADGKYRGRMPDSQIGRVLKMAEKINGLVFLDIQLGRSNLASELPLLKKYLQLPQVHLGIDPEFAVGASGVPGQIMGTLDASDINYAANYLAEIVRENDLPPKILVVHRFTKAMLTNYENIRPLPETQIVIDMDGFGGQAKKLNTYRMVAREPVQFTGFKLFYKKEAAEGQLLRAEQLLKLQPIPIYIQYQ